MKLKIEGAYHWFSIGSMAVAVSMVCSGQTVLEPALQSAGNWVSLLFWGVCAASVIATVTFAYLALLNAEQRVRALASRPGQR